jgi:hypothetical protein
MPEYEDDEDFQSREMGMVRVSDGVYVMDLTNEARIPADLHLLQKLDAILVEARRTNQYLSELTNMVVD